MSVRISVEGAKPVAFRAAKGSGFEFDPDAWVELAYPHAERRTMMVGGKKVSYEARFTPAGMAAMVAKFRAKKEADPAFGVLVNIDHLALQMDQKTEAAAWIDDLKLGEDGHLYGKFRWSTLGDGLAKGGVYRFVSVEVDCDATPRADWPTKGVEWDRLDGAAVTNDHALKNLRPFCHRAEGQPIEETNQTKGPQMENLKKMLGLAPEATEADVEAAVKALQDKAAEEAKAKAEAEMTQKAEAFGKKYADRFKDEAAAATFFRATPERAEELVATFRSVEAQKPVAHRKGGTPDDADDQTPAGCYRKWSEMADGPAKDLYFDQHTESINAGATKAEAKTE